MPSMSTTKGLAVAFFLQVRADYVDALHASRATDDTPDTSAPAVRIAEANLDAATSFLRATGVEVCADCRQLACTCPNV